MAFQKPRLGALSGTQRFPPPTLHYTLSMDDRHVIDLGCETELVECGEHSFVALQLTMDGIPAGDLCIVPIVGFHGMEVSIVWE